MRVEMISAWLLCFLVQSGYLAGHRLRVLNLFSWSS